MDKIDRWPMPKWDPQVALDYMDKMGIRTGMMTISSPHIHFGNNAETRKLARNLNENGAELVQRYPDRFGLLAVLPLPDCDGTLIEMEYALDVLKADGVKFTSNAAGLYLGDPKMDEIFQEMNKRGALGVIHPTYPGAVPPHSCDEVPIPAMEFIVDTTRAVCNLMFKGVMRRNPNMKIVAPHCGGIFPMLVDRLDAMAAKSGLVQNPPDVFAEMKRFYYDLAGFCLPRILPALRTYIDIDKIVYGSDYPYMNAEVTSQLGAKLMAEGGFTDDEMKKVLYGNAMKLFPRLQQYY